jgi:transducin (beta)-like 1
MISNKSNYSQDGVDQRMMESLSLIDAVMPDIVATRQQALQQQTQQSGTVTKGPAGLIKQEQESNGDESNAFYLP